MQRFSTHFVRESEGIFRCMSHAAFPLPNGHKIEVAPNTVLSSGTAFMGVDLASMLEDHYRHTKQVIRDSAPI
ncbi:MAG TPA: hypothetical protein VL180_10430 [Burkholderiales bacterium]|nr:hypothetical protein [Burkholderiales bacterium]